jgi:hypothetical protein
MTTPTLLRDGPEVWSPAALAMRPRWQKCRDVRGGTEVMRAKASEYLPKFEAEDPRDWTARVNLTFTYDALALTLDTLTGLAFTTEPELGEDVPARIALEWENIDGEGTHGSIFALQLLDSALQDGHDLILTEFPPVEGALTLAEEQARGIRAYLVRITIDQIPSWRVMVYGGRRILGQIVIATKVEEPTGAFGMTMVPEYRVYRQQFTAAGVPFVEWERWRTNPNGTETALVEGPTTLRGPQFIPIAPVFGGQRTGFLESLPPLVGLADSNIDHTQVKSDRRYSMHKCAIPIPIFINRDKGAQGTDQIIMSPSRGIDINTGGDAKILEPQGTALEALRNELLDIERRMADQGVAMLQRDTATPRTATEVEFSRTRQESKLARAVRSLQDALEASFQFMADYYGLPDGGSITIRRDFAALTLSDSDAAMLTATRERGDLTLPTFLDFMRQRGGVFEKLNPKAEAEAVRREQGAETMGLEEPPLVIPAGQQAA